MFKLDTENNTITKLNNSKFSELNLKEREHLQEWIAKNPSSLGDVLGLDLLIIQKEFDGFDKTRERLDLLALTKDPNGVSAGRLVIIENKLDDSGSNVVWQATKYAAYCSTLTTLQIINIYQQYLNKYEKGADAKKNLCEFFSCSESDLDTLELNPGSDQIIVLVASYFRQEVTATAMWMRSKNIDVRCVKFTPYSEINEDKNIKIFIDIQKIIPPPGVEDYLIALNEKNNKISGAKSLSTNSQVRVRRMWSYLNSLNKQGTLKVYFNEIVEKDYYFTAHTSKYSGKLFQASDYVRSVLKSSDFIENIERYKTFTKNRDIMNLFQMIDNDLPVGPSDVTLMYYIYLDYTDRLGADFIYSDWFGNDALYLSKTDISNYLRSSLKHQNEFQLSDDTVALILSNIKSDYISVAKLADMIDSMSEP